MKFKTISLSDYDNEQEIDELLIIEGIENNPALEKVIPPKWHAFVNELIQDYNELDNRSFYEKYKKTIGLGQIWFLLKEYEEENEGGNLLGSLIVFAMVEKGCILQLDYKEDLENYDSNIKKFWDIETKLVQFILDNDQNYYALVPYEVDISAMYEIPLKDVK